MLRECLFPRQLFFVDNVQDGIQFVLTCREVGGELFDLPFAFE